jgi:acetyltransferase
MVWRSEHLKTSSGMIAGDQPYPSQWERHLVLSDGRRFFARPIRPDDEPLVLQLLQHVSAEDLRLRFFDSIREFTHPFVAKLTQLDYGRAMAFIALDETSAETLGVVRVYFDTTGEAGEYAILLRSDIKGHGLGWSLMQMMIEYSRSKGLKRIVGQILQENSVMLSMCRDLGFKVEADTDDRGLCDVTLVLEPVIASDGMTGLSERGS